MLYNAESLVVPELHCPFIAELAPWILHESVFFSALLTDAHRVLGHLGWKSIWGRCIWYCIAALDLCVQKSTGDVIQVLMHCILDLEDLEAASDLNG